MLHFLSVVYLVGRGHTDPGVTYLRKIAYFHLLHLRKEKKKNSI